jgi:urease accessory protein
VWEARLELEFREQPDGRSRLSACRHRGPLLVQRLFHPEPDGTAHAYLLHPPGGIAGGDRLEIAIDAGPRARALVTTPAATKVYRSAGALAEQCTHLRVAAGAALEWLPQETIVFDGARTRTALRVELEPGARFAGWEITCLGRTGAGERFTRGCWQQRLEVYEGDRPLAIERLAAEAGDALLAQPWGLGGQPVSATLLLATGADGGAPRELVAAIRERIGADGTRRDGELVAASALDGIAVCRYLGGSAPRARAALAAAWELYRTHVLGRTAVAPRIWAT